MKAHLRVEMGLRRENCYVVIESPLLDVYAMVLNGVNYFVNWL